jgi:uncharacterized membrane protein
VTQADGGAEARGGRRWITIALVISLAVNLLVLGLAAGAGWKNWHGGRRHAFSQGMERLLDKMPPERREPLQALFDRYKTEVRPMWRQVRDARRDVIESMRAEPYDENKVRESVAALHTRQAKARDEFTDVILQVMSKLSDEERSDLLSGFGPPPKDRSGD